MFPEYLPRAGHSAGSLMSKIRSPPLSKLDSEPSLTLGHPLTFYKKVFTVIQLPHGIQVEKVPVSLREGEKGVEIARSLVQGHSADKPGWMVSCF